jgi:hypothetical protein
MQELLVHRLDIRRDAFEREVGIPEIRQHCWTCGIAAIAVSNSRSVALAWLSNLIDTNDITS